jgi:pSer/pThr/pTyr-binding forkhead associated (FHA) protein
MTTNTTADSPNERSCLAISPRLIAVDGPLFGQTFYLDEPFVSIGRLASNDICLDDRFVSRVHCVIRTEDGKYVIEDLNSANGTYVNGERVNAGALNEGSLIEIGDSRFLFELPAPEEFVSLGQNLVAAEHGSSLSNDLRSA